MYQRKLLESNFMAIKRYNELSAKVYLLKLILFQTNCFLVCFSVDKNLASYDNVYLKWVPEVKHFGPNVPIIIVGKMKIKNSKYYKL